MTSLFEYLGQGSIHVSEDIDMATEMRSDLGSLLRAKLRGGQRENVYTDTKRVFRIQTSIQKVALSLILWKRDSRIYDRSQSVSLKGF